MIKKTIQKLKKRKEEEHITIDWPHRYLIHHVQYRKPSLFTTSSQYREYSEKDFAEVVEDSINMINSVDLDGTHPELVDNQIRLREQYLMAELSESRVLHQWEAEKLKSDITSELVILLRKAVRLREKLDELGKERQNLLEEELL